ncbi:MAG: hypothetical protein J6W35_08385 [Eubacterium sp.]|nr:hypothetical protein [Eubacterium sp.]
MKKILIMFMFALFVVCVYKKDVKALSGSGTTASPYIVTKGSELKEALSKGSSSWKYIAVTDVTAITETINVSTGKFRIYASGGNQTIRRSQSMSATVNSSSNPLRCIKLEGTTEIEWGYKANSYTLTLNGSKNYFTDSRQCNEFFYVASSASLTIGANCVLTNAKNTMRSNEAAPIRTYGNTSVYGEISNCEGNNGGAIKCISGSINVYSGAKIHGCKSGTEGGALYGKDFSNIIVNAGSIYSNQAAEEGGGIFSTEGNVIVESGSIYNNTAGKTGGGIFVGNEGSLSFGKNGSGPTVSGNYAKNSGGGVRCNGGTDVSGGLSTFEGGTITGNKTDVSGGGISIGKPSSGRYSKISITNMTITNNTAGNYGGGICFSEGVKGKNTDEVIITKTTVSGNKATTGGGGIHINTVVKLTESYIKNNNSDIGGGTTIASNGKLMMPSSVIESNTANKGEGVYQNGLLELSTVGYVNSNNTVYLPKGKHIDITGKIRVSNVLVSYIDSEVKTKGTILVVVNYGVATAEDELYYEGSGDEEANGNPVTKKFAAKGGYILRPSNKNTSLNSSRYIIISERYDVKYNGNSLDSVANLPKDGIAFWSEKYKVSDNIVSRIGFVLNINKHWNLSADGTGSVMKPGVDTLINSDTTLYAIWDELVISSLTMTTVDRYYVVGQKITLTAKELTKKVEVENDLNLPITYEVRVTKIVNASGKTVAEGASLKAENYIDTSKAATYKLYLESSNEAGSVTCSGSMRVTIMEDYYDKTEVRFISSEFVNTLDPRSKWNREKKSELMASLNNEDDYLYSVELDEEFKDAFRDNINMNGHKIDHVMNYIVSWKVIEKQ